jgi:hypothetical protein
VPEILFGHQSVPWQPNGGEGATYTPLPGRPGFDANFQPTYNITSDSHSELPEPAV